MRPFAVLGLFAVVFVTLAAGCSSDKKSGTRGASGAVDGTPIALPGGRAGSSFGPASERGVIVIADGTNTGVWSALAEELGRAGYRTIVIAGTGSDDAAAARAAAGQAVRQGVERVVFIGDGRGAAAALEAAAADGTYGVAVLNPPGTLEPPTGGLPPVPLLAMASLTDGPSSAAAQHVYQLAAEPRTLALYPARDPAPAVFAGETNELRTALFDFLRAAFQPLSA